MVNPEMVLALASASPRRRELLEGIGIATRVFPADIDESMFDRLPVADRVQALAKRKVLAAPIPPDAPRWALGADTLVAIDGIAMGKPASREEAASMLRSLSGRTHVVLTGLALLDRSSGELRTQTTETSVTFAFLRDPEIVRYLDSCEWEGVAGAYRIQERGAVLVERLEGSYSNVVGLPLRELYVMMRDAGAFRSEGDRRADA